MTTITESQAKSTNIPHISALDPDRPMTDSEARTAFRNYVAAGSLARETPRGKREKIHNYYTAVTMRALSALGAPDCAFKLISGLRIALGDEIAPGGWYDLTDASLATATTGQTHRMTDADRDTLIRREAESHRKRRRRTLAWQALPDAPEIIVYDGRFDRETGRNRSRYQIPFIAVIRDIVEDAPVGSSERRLAKAIADHTSAYLESYTGTARRTPKRQKHSPESDLTRAATVAGKAAVVLLSNPIERHREADIAAGMAIYADRLDTAAGSEISAKMLRYSVLAHARKYPDSKELQSLYAEMPTILASPHGNQLQINDLPCAEDALTCGTTVRGYDSEILDTHSIYNVRDFVASDPPAKEGESQRGDDSETSPDDLLRQTEALESPPPVILSSGVCVSDFDPETEAVQAVEAFASVGGEITEAAQLDELDGDAMTLLQAVLSVGGEVDQAFFKNDKEARGAGKGIDDEAKDLTTKITTERFSELLAGAIAKAGLMIRSFIARIRGPLLQIDDCDEHTVLRFEPFALFVAETSPQNFQVWLAFKDEEDKEAAAKRLFTGKNGALAGGLKGNRGSSGAIRWAGSRNFKRDGGPLVRLDSVQMGRITTPAELDDAGLLAPAVEAAPVGPVGRTVQRRGRPKQWPDYGISLAGADVKKDGSRDRSQADARWVAAALGWGWSLAEVEAELPQVSERARTSRPGYVADTVRRVAARVHITGGR